MTVLRSMLLITALVAAACGSASSSGTSAGGASTASAVTATLSDTKITLDQAGVPAGTVTFTVKNAGTVVHSLVVLKTDVPHDKLPMDPSDQSKVAQTGLVKETGQIAIGQTKTISAKLEAGNYVIVCNEPAHYLVGMHTPFVVK